MHQHLHQSFAAVERGQGLHALQAANARPEPKGAPTWVSKFVDYTSKYGLGYIMADGSVGVYFNDSSKIILATDSEHFEYMERAHRLPCGRRAPVVRQAHTMSKYQPELKKKVTLLRHFRGHLLQQQVRARRTNGAENGSHSKRPAALSSQRHELSFGLV